MASIRIPVFPAAAARPVNPLIGGVCRCQTRCAWRARSFFVAAPSRPNAIFPNNKRSTPPERRRAEEQESGLITRI